VPRRLALAALALCCLGCGPRPIDPALLHYFTAEQITRADEFVAPLRLNWACGELVTLVFFAVFLGFRLNRRLKLWCEARAARWGVWLVQFRVPAAVGRVLGRMWKDGTWGGALLFALTYLAIQFALSVPGDFYFGWLWEQRHGTSVSSLGRWAWDVAKGLASEATVLSMLVFGAYGLARWMRRWWLVLGLVSAAGIFAVGGLLDPLNEQLYYQHQRLPDGPTKERVAAALKKAGVEYDDIYQQKVDDVTRRTNAYIAGEGPTRRIVLFDTLVKVMTPDEAANAVAHEVGHLRDHSPGRLAMAAACALPLAACLAWVLRRLGRTRRLGFEDDRDVASLPFVFLVSWLLSVVSGPFGNAYNRALERRADAYAFELLEQPAAFRSMMVKLARTNLADVHPPLWVRTLFSGHPPVMERIGAAEQFARARGIPMGEPQPADFAIPAALDPLEQSRR
jgi:STE24 endopeptidase